MSTLNLLRGAQTEGPATTLPACISHWRDSNSSLGRAVTALLDDARAGRMRTTGPGDTWLVLRLEEALQGFDDIRAMAGGDDAATTESAGEPAGSASILAERAQAS